MARTVAVRFLTGVLCLLSGHVGAADGTSLLADLTDEVRLALDARPENAPLPADPAELLEQVLRAATPYRFGTELFVVLTDRRWYSTVEPETVNEPALVLRRWPGDTVAAFYAIDGALPAKTEPSVVIPDSELEPGAATDTERRWRARMETGLGERPAIWIERAVGEAGAHLGILLLPGDAGLGGAAIASLEAEAQAVVGRVQLMPEAWANARGIERGTALGLPTLGRPPGDGDERSDPWQIARGDGFTIGLPPGIRARRTDLGLESPRPLAGQLLWLRGRFIDRDGQPVVVGDGVRGGYVARIVGRSAEWTSGKAPPLGAPGSIALAGEPYPIAVEWTGADEARAERWREPGFEGEWLVFRLGVAGDGIEIGLPVLAGRRSLALFWIPAMWRGAGQAPAPPPVDPAKRFGIRFEKLQGKDRRTRPLTEGFLWTPGLRVEVPTGWWPVANLRSVDGFPIALVDETGRVVGRLRFLEDGPRGLEPDGWQEVRRPRSHGAREVRRREDGTWVYVSADGWAALLEPVDTSEEESAWERLARSVGLRPIRE